VKYIGSDDFKAWGVTSHNVVESAPMTEVLENPKSSSANLSATKVKFFNTV
jgi:hypothetical protein